MGILYLMIFLILISNQGMTTEISDLLEVGKSSWYKTVLLTAQPRTAIAKKLILYYLPKILGSQKLGLVLLHR